MMEKFGKSCKEKMVQDYARSFTGSGALFVTSFQKLPSTELEGLRRKIKTVAASDFMVVKNAVAKKALKAEGAPAVMAEMDRYFAGSCGVAVTNADPVAIAKILVDFAKSHETMKIQGGYVEGRTVTIDAIKGLSQLPPKDVLIAMVLRGMKSPLYGLAGVLTGVLRSVLYALNAVKEKKSNG